MEPLLQVPRKALYSLYTPVYLSLDCIEETSCPHVYHLQSWHDCQIFICQRPHGQVTKSRFTGTIQGAWSCMCLICTREKCTSSAMVRCHARCGLALRGIAPMRASSLPKIRMATSSTTSMPSMSRQVRSSN